MTSLLNVSFNSLSGAKALAETGTLEASSRIIKESAFDYAVYVSKEGNMLRISKVGDGDLDHPTIYRLNLVSGELMTESKTENNTALMPGAPTYKEHLEEAQYLLRQVIDSPNEEPSPANANKLNIIYTRLTEIAGSS